MKGTLLTIVLFVICTILCMIVSIRVFGQLVLHEDTAAGAPHTSVFFDKKAKSSFIPLASGVLPLHLDGDSILFGRRICKSFKIVDFISVKRQIVPDIGEDSQPAVKNDRPVLLRIHGNVQYDFLYQSFVDTPFSQHGFQQHTVQTTLNILLKDKYPLNVNLSNRKSNSPYFRNFLDLNLHFDQYALLNNKKQELLSRIEEQRINRPDLKKMEAALNELKGMQKQLQDWLNSPDVLQRIIEEREKNYYRKLALAASQKKRPLLPDISLNEPGEKFGFRKKNLYPKKDSILPYTGYHDLIKKKRRQMDSLQQKIAGLEASIEGVRNSINDSALSLKRKVYGTNDYGELQKVASLNNIDSGKEKNFEKFISGIKSIGIGRSFVNYSELTAWNVSLTGFNMEYNPGLYGAIAAGRVDHGFRDFFDKSISEKRQNLFLGRVGVGDKDRKAIIFSAFTGRKYNYGSPIADTVSSYVRVVGYSVEAILKRSENISLTAEVAKTTKPISGSFRDNNALHDLVNFSDMSNLGVSIKGQTFLKKTDTRLSAFYRKTGESFQSFSPFTYNTDQTSWQVKADQSFFHDKLDMIASLKRNDFANPFIEKTFKASTIFKSFQINARFPRWPIVTVAYYPGTQMYIVDKDRIRENAYYILNGSLVHSYSASGIRMVSSFLYNRYASKGTDTGFISYQGINYIVAHTFIFPRLQLKGSYTYTDQEAMKFYALEAGVDYTFSKIISLGTAGRYNKIKEGKAYWGGSARLVVDFETFGALQLQYENYYLPTIDRSLFPIETGRVSWFKNF